MSTTQPQHNIKPFSIVRSVDLFKQSLDHSKRNGTISQELESKIRKFTIVDDDPNLFTHRFCISQYIGVTGDDDAEKSDSDDEEASEEEEEENIDKISL